MSIVQGSNKTIGKYFLTVNLDTPIWLAIDSYVTFGNRSEFPPREVPIAEKQMISR